MASLILPGISWNVLDGLAAAYRAGRLERQVTAISLKANGYSGIPGLLEGLTDLAKRFSTDEQVANVLAMLAGERRGADETARRRVELVWSGPEGKGQSRDTAIVIGELFAKAQRKVLMSTYNVGWKRGLFGPLVEKMQRDSRFELTMFVHIDGELTKHFMQSGRSRFRHFGGGSSRRIGIERDCRRCITIRGGYRGCTPIR